MQLALSSECSEQHSPTASLAGSTSERSLTSLDERASSQQLSPAPSGGVPEQKVCPLLVACLLPVHAGITRGTTAERRILDYTREQPQS